jgi:2-polyprenyl-3-methyl-5-hydroxy-6-metoxy-1,4-benzoquinol methylase
MLNDKIRCGKYKEAIEKVVQGKTVLDVGCGTGILSAYAAIAGATSITGVDKADVGSFMTKILDEYGVKDKVKFINKTIEDLAMEGSRQQFDVIVSEWMGYFLLFENMVHSVIIAR